MKKLLLTLMFVALPSLADEPAKAEIPTTEKEFVKAIASYSKEEIIAQFGEPQNKDDLTDRNTGEIVASIWEYESINTDENGEYFKKTELDFLGDRVNVVVFINDDEQKKLMNVEPMVNEATEIPLQ